MPPRHGTQTAQHAVAVTPNDSTNLPSGTCRALYVGGTGDISLIPAGSATAVLFTAVPVGILPVACTRVRATATTATAIVALY